MPADFLEKIIAHKKKINKDKDPYFAELKKKVGGEKFTSYHIFKKEIAKPGRINLIAEIKKASPSRGLIRDDFEVLNIAKIYKDSGADAFSILTEEKFFLGKPMYINQVSENFSIPILTKDFIIDEGQIWETFTCGTSAILLIAAILTDAELKRLMDVARQIDLDILVEVHDERELDRVLKTDADIIGINNRNLKTFEVDLKTAEKLIPKVPKDKVIVVESGVETHEQVVMFKELGANAVLIGETFMRSPDIAKKVKEVMYGAKA